MSLLAGIKFVPKEHRDQNNRDKDKKAAKKSHNKHHHRRHRDSDSSDSSDSDDDKRKKKERKDKSDRRHRHKRDRDASSSSSDTERKSKNKDNYSKRRKNEESDDDDPFAVMRNFSATQQQDNSTTAHQSNSTNQTTVDSTKPKEFDASKFRSLLAGLTGNTTSVANPIENTKKNTQSDNEIEEEMDYYSSRPSATSEVPSDAATNHIADPSLLASSVSSAVNSNHNMAAMLRQRLKSGQSLASPSSSSGNKPAGTNSDLHLAMQRQQLVQRATNSLKDGGKRNDQEGPSLSIQQLMQQEKFANDADMDLVFAKNVLRMGGKYAGNDFGSDKAGMDEEAAIDMRMYQQKAKPVTDLHQQMKQDFRQLKQRQEKKKRALDSCRLCQAVSLSSSSSSSGSTSNTASSYVSQLEICRGDYFLLRLKASGYRLSATHCELIPLEHTSSLLLYPSHCTASSTSSATAHASSNRIDETTEAIWKEFRRFVTAFRRMRHTDDGQDTTAGEHSVIVMESAAHRGSHDLHTHTVIDLVSVSRQLVDEIVMSFKMAFNEESSDWAQHRSQIALSKQKPLVTAIPKHFPYYFVEWAEDTGVVHPIDDGSSNGIAGGAGDTAAGRDTEDYGAGRLHGKNSAKDAGFFCFDVLAVAMEEDEARWRRTRPSETPAQLQAVKTQFLQKWRPVSSSWLTKHAAIGK